MKIAARIVLLLILIAFLPVHAGAGQAAAGHKQQSGKADDLTIMGDALANERQAVNFIRKYAPNAQINCTVDEIVRIYYKEAALEGIRPDLALSQALLETGFFRYGGEVKAYQNNFCGLGSVGRGAKGAVFATPELGVRAHIQHLLVYSSKQPPKTKIVDPRYEMARKLPHIYGVCKTWKDLNGRWAAKGVPYGERVLDIHWRMLQTEPRAPAAVEQPSAPLTPDDTDDKKPERKKRGRKVRERELEKENKNKKK